LQESVRKLTVRVKWNEPGKPEQSIEVVNFLTDPSRLETAVTLAATGGTGGASGSTGGAGKASSSGTSNSATKK
jgi:hypothetical protein